jgi:hypothetical protein
MVTGARLVQAEAARERISDRCVTCRVYGRLNVRRRPVYRLAAPAITGERLDRERCWDCGGKGRVQ